MKINENKNIEDLEGEIWKDIQGYEGEYQVSNLGRVKSLPREIYINRPGAPYLGRYKGKILSQIPSILGDRVDFRVTIPCRIKKRAKLFAVSRLVCQSFHSNPDNKEQVNHKDGDTENNNEINLEWSTRQENMDHAWANGLRESFREKVRGENNFKTQLTNEQVLEIRRKAKEGIPRPDLEKQYNIGKSGLGLILANITWKHLL